ncbi:uncharacterized protein LOC8287219 [Ricinus communis]|uniref:C2H2-type domain-containing protein n=1 Tax=Ricinus communis TaxID=3988 RepID=B9SWJ9_RICCO|nr:uncharacterized protein LOC8287219 [Ricinus communis]EEF32029.1 conserved hypothetical protein [Ricinus communis]|eukprot:XP_002530368.1 uncharacterized protein LOC8287219 [Ricinus communis]
MQSKTNSCESSNTGSIRRATSIGSLLTLNQPDVYICTRCSRGFPSSQSLGGHQNAHRRERNAERRVMQEERKSILEKIKRTEMNILSSTRPWGASPPPKPTPTDHQYLKPHFAISLDKLGHDHNGPLAGLKPFLDFQVQVGMGIIGLPPASASMAAANSDHHEVPSHDEIDLEIEGDELPYVAVPTGDDNNQNNPTTELMPWELIQFPDSDSSTGQVEEEAGSMKGKKKSNKVTIKKDLDLNLKL